MLLYGNGKAIAYCIEAQKQKYVWAKTSQTTGIFIGHEKIISEG